MHISKNKLSCGSKFTQNCRIPLYLCLLFDNNIWERGNLHPKVNRKRADDVFFSWLNCSVHPFAKPSLERSKTSQVAAFTIFMSSLRLLNYRIFGHPCVHFFLPFPEILVIFIKQGWHFLLYPFLIRCWLSNFFLYSFILPLLYQSRRWFLFILF